MPRRWPALPCRVARCASRTVGLILLLLFAGCHHFLPGGEPPSQASPLKPTNMAGDGVALEIFLTRCHPDDPRLDEVWHDIDETALSTASRRRLVGNGFRAGILGGTLPEAVAGLFRFQNEASSEEPSAETLTLDGPAVTRHLQTYHNGRRGEINASGPHARLPIVLFDEEGTHGHTVSDAQCVYVIRPTLLPGQQIELELTPEIHHGEARNRYTADGRYWRLDISQEREVLQSLRTQVTLSPGQMLILGPSPGSSGSLGQAFHTTPTAEGPRTKLLMIRLAQIPPDA